MALLCCLKCKYKPNGFFSILFDATGVRESATGLLFCFIDLVIVPLNVGSNNL